MKKLLVIGCLLWAINASAQTVLYKWGKDSIPVYLFGDSLPVAEEYDYWTDTLNTYILVDEKTFLSYKKAAKNALVIDTNTKRVNWLDTTFNLTVNGQIFNYQHRQKTERYDIPLYDYVGYIKPLGLYAISWVDSPNEIGGLYFIDAKTGRYYEYPTAYSYLPEKPLLSNSGKRLLFYENDGYEQNDAAITLFDISQKKGVYTYKFAWDNITTLEGFNAGWDFNCTHLDFEGKRKRWFIDDATWVNDTTLIFKICHYIAYDEDLGADVKLHPLYLMLEIGKRPFFDK